MMVSMSPTTWNIKIVTYWFTFWFIVDFGAVTRARERAHVDPWLLSELRVREVSIPF